MQFRRQGTVEVLQDDLFAEFQNRELCRREMLRGRCRDMVDLLLRVSCGQRLDLVTAIADLATVVPGELQSHQFLGAPVDLHVAFAVVEHALVESFVVPADERWMVREHPEIRRVDGTLVRLRTQRLEIRREIRPGHTFERWIRHSVALRTSESNAEYRSPGAATHN